MSKVTIAANQEPQLDHQLQALAEMWQREQKWWLELGTNHAVTWCFENQIAIMALYSSDHETPIFAV
jgi:hypothetical protein